MYDKIFRDNIYDEIKLKMCIGKCKSNLISPKNILYFILTGITDIGEEDSGSLHN